MLRIAACWACIVLSATGAFATCADEVIAAWRRLRVSGPYAFTISTARSKLSGFVDWPRALRHWQHYANGRSEWVRIGWHQWSFQNGRWYDAGEILPPLAQPIEDAILWFERLFDFEAEWLAKEIHDVSCLGPTTRDGREYTAYAYGVRRAGSLLFIRETLYVDTMTGLPARQEYEQRQTGPHGPVGPTVWRRAELRFDASIKIEPPIPFVQ